MARWRNLVIAALLLLGAPDAAHAQGRRVALVVGNSAYQAVPRLGNPGNDARLMARTLSALGFSLVDGAARLDLTYDKFRKAVRSFGAAAAGADVAVFYYAGHGVQVRGSNWLVPVDANPTREQDIDYMMVDAASVLDQMAGAGTKLNVMILDACRNDPFAGRGLRGGAPGLKEMVTPKSTLISYATQPGNVARDGDGGDSPYTLALVDEMRKPGVDVLRMFNGVGLDVMCATNDEQRPWVAASPIDGDYFFTSPRRGPTPLPPVVAMAARPPPAPAPTAKAMAQVVFPASWHVPEMVTIPAGRFVMGTPVSEIGRFADEAPRHEVRISRAFDVGKYPVTFEEWDACVTDGGCGGYRPPDQDWGRGRRPVINVSWDDAQAYVSWLSGRTRQSWRLLSEAEWEYAARAGTTTSYYWGNAIGQNNANCDGCGSTFDNRQSAPVGSFAPNPWGLYGMAGNVSQWTSDCSNETYAVPRRTPRPGTTGIARFASFAADPGTPNEHTFAPAFGSGLPPGAN